MQYTLTEVTEIPAQKGRSRASSTIYNDIIKDFIENQYPMAKAMVPGKNPDTVARRLESRVTSGMSVHGRGDAVYLINHNLVSPDE